jgi:hypothetical protein
MKPAPPTRRSVPNVIPFGDWTVDEMDATADLFGISVADAYDAAQEPILANLVEDDIRANPPKKWSAGIAEKVWIPLGRLATGIEPTEFEAKRLEVPADSMAFVSNTAAKAGSLAEIRKALVSVMETVRDTWSQLTPESWARMQLEGWWVRKGKPTWSARGISKADAISRILKGRSQEARTVLASLKPLTTEGYRTSVYWEQVGKLVDWLEDPISKTPPFTVFTEGSSKLPFFQWSTLPGATCPGAGRCWTHDREPDLFQKRGSTPSGGPRGYCYSLSGWRNVVPYLRQLQNTILLRLESKTGVVNRALREIDTKRPGAVVRLYVDGDFDSIETLDFWMHICERYPGLRFYGYSKSWDILLEWDRRNAEKWPDNYTLNLSNGTFYERMDSGGEESPYRKILKKMMALKCTRGRFVAVRMPKGPHSEAPKLSKDEVVQDGVAIKNPRDNPATAKRLALHRAAVKAEGERQGINPGVKPDGTPWNETFVCPGLCGFCLGSYDKGSNTPDGTHACAFDRFKGRTILIAVH